MTGRRPDQLSGAIVPGEGDCGKTERTGYLQVGLAMGRVVDEPRGIAGLGAVHRHLAVQPERVAPLDVVRQLAAERNPRSDPGNANNLNLSRR